MEWRRWAKIVCAVAVAAVLAGCASNPINNLTPAQVPVNASGIYTFSFAPRISEATLVEGSERARLVINEEVIPMRKTAGGVFEAEYRIPLGQRSVLYFYEFDYKFRRDGQVVDVTEKSRDVKTLRLLEVFASQLLADRGPVGARIGVNGQGFTRADRIVFGGVELETFYNSPNNLHFFVPSVIAGQRYPVSLSTRGGELQVGTFQVDLARLTASPEALELAPGARATLVLGLDFEAPPGGLLVEVTTNIPKSVIMPEVIVPAGAKVVDVPVQAGEPGQGMLFLEAPGFEELRVPFTVR